MDVQFFSHFMMCPFTSENLDVSLAWQTWRECIVFPFRAFVSFNVSSIAVHTFLTQRYLPLLGMGKHRMKIGRENPLGTVLETRNNQRASAGKPSLPYPQ